MQHVRLRFLIVFGIGLPVLSIAQDNTLGERNQSSAIESKYTPLNQRKVRKANRAFFHKSNVKHTAQYEFYARMEVVAKEKQRMLKELARPQYSNFLYFGHKKKPKKHKPWEMRYCKECGIRH